MYIVNQTRTHIFNIEAPIYISQTVDLTWAIYAISDETEIPVRLGEYSTEEEARDILKHLSEKFDAVCLPR